jgi:hypothetical protein
MHQIDIVGLTGIGTRDTTTHRLERPKEGSATTRPTIQKIPKDHDVLPKVYNYIYKNICKIGKYR